MERGKVIIVTAYCILNQNAVVKPLARAKGAYNQIVEGILEHNWGIHQLPCPETLFLGLERKPMTKQEYNQPEFLALCQKLAEVEVDRLLIYQQAGYRIVGVLGINHSPTCSLQGEKGIFMEHLMEIAENKGLKLKFNDVSTQYKENEKQENINKLLRFFEKNQEKQTK